MFMGKAADMTNNNYSPAFPFITSAEDCSTATTSANIYPQKMLGKKILFQKMYQIQSE